MIRSSGLWLRRNVRGFSSKMLWLIISFVLMSIVGYVLMHVFSSNVNSSAAVIRKNIDLVNTDYDADGIMDFNDDSPCIPGERLVVGMDKMYAFYADIPSSGGCDAVEHPDYFTLLKVTDKDIGKDVCVLDDRSCANRLKVYYDCLHAKEKGKEPDEDIC